MCISFYFDVIERRFQSICFSIYSTYHIFTIFKNILHLFTRDISNRKEITDLLFKLDSILIVIQEKKKTKNIVIV